MGLFTATFSATLTTFDIAGVKAGSAPEMETKLNALLAASATPPLISDMVLAGVEQGPEWEAALVLSTTDLNGADRTVAACAAAVAGNKTEAYQALLARLVELNTESAITAITKVEIAGGGDGSSFMALALFDRT